MGDNQWNQGERKMDVRSALATVEARKGWQEPSDETLSQAVLAVDAMLSGSRRPENPIERGVRYHIMLRREEGADPAADREGLIMATTRVMELDAEPISSRVDTVGAARMISLDMSLQRDARLFAGLDVIDRQELLSPRELEGRGADWRAMRGIMSSVITEPEDGLEALSRGDMSGVSKRLSASHRNSIDAARMGMGDELDLRIMRVANLMPPEVAAEIASVAWVKQSREQTRVFMDARAKGRRMDARDLMRGDGRDRETITESAKIARRRTLMDERGIYAGGVGEADRSQVARAVAEASYPEPESAAAKAVVAAALVLKGHGVEDAVTSPQMSRALAREMSEFYDSGMKHEHRESVGRIVMDVALQLDAARHLEDARTRVAEAERGWGDRSPRSMSGGAFDAVSKSFMNLLTSSPRDMADLEKLAAGDVNGLSDTNGMYSFVRRAVERAGDRERVKTKDVGRDNVATRGENPAARSVAKDHPRPDLSSITKGPQSRLSGSDWMGMMKKGLGSGRD